ncbi:hypothetical protein QBC38DRAFT_464667 [Podospora fimiseda]|uniref:Uncharacterized protein n=1 Tax=Podospora fimiseda TaxID=252190 RepID=A0AAN7BZ20_9PEZI|nr:hypothetical protein QBC38DRAFT_464667 [Podospora fimiseda]
MVTATDIDHGAALPQCQALYLSDSSPCKEDATANDNLFCRFHAKQCWGLYMGYKRRTKELMTLRDNKPPFLQESKIVSLASQTFEGIKTKEELKKVHGYLFDLLVLLERVIMGRKLHHKHFYSLTMDYGHKTFLDQLVSERHSVQKGLENLERRTAEILYKEEKWFDWVREVQEKEDQKREKEQKKIKMEAALFRRHRSEMEARLAAARKKEAKRREDAFLEEAWRQERQRHPDWEDVDGKTESEWEDDSGEWDPIEDVFEDDRGRYLDLIRHFLWIEAPVAEKVEEAEKSAEVDAAKAEKGIEEVVEAAAGGDKEEASATPKKKQRKRGGKKKKKAIVEDATEDGQEEADNDKAKPQQEPDKSRIESKEDIRTRLRIGVKKDYSHLKAPLLVGTVHNPVELMDRTAPVKDEDIDKLIADITEIKELLFCRQIMAQSALLPAALRANSVEEYLNDAEIPDSELRDLCLKVENPTLQALRDACADFAHGDEPDEDEESDDETDKYGSAVEYISHHFRYGDLDDFFLEALSSSSREALKTNEKVAKAAADEQEAKDKKMKVKVCGRSIWNYASQKSMARDGWLHFSIMAKDCEFPQAMSLCRNWDEFFELNVLALWQYFPASKWTGWSGNWVTEEFTQQGFVPFWMDLTAYTQTTYNQLGTVSRKVLRKQSCVVEARNFICAHMKRNDPVTRRFIQYALMRPGEELILVRDGKTGRIIVAPPENHRWIARTRSGVGIRPGHPDRDNDGWEVHLEVDSYFFDIAEEQRSFDMNFNDYYEIYIWDFAPGHKAIKLYQFIKECLDKAHRITGNRQRLAHLKPIMQSVTREPDTKRVRQIKPGEKVKSLFEELAGPDAKFVIKTTRGEIITTSQDIPPGVSPYMYYNQTDKAEDAILFAEEQREGMPDNMPFVEITNPVHQLEVTPMPVSVLNHTATEMVQQLHTEEDGSPKPNLIKMLDGGNGNEARKKPYAPGADEFPFRAPPIWQQMHKIITQNATDAKRTHLLDKLDFRSIKLNLSISELKERACSQEIMERDRAYIFKDTFHLGDLEPGAQERYQESMKLIIGLQKYESPNPEKHLDWPWFCMEILDWLNLKIYYEDYVREPIDPWPHRYILQDIVQAFMTMGLFFPNVGVTSIIQQYLASEQGQKFKDSKIFDPVLRQATRPDVRTRTSCAYRPKKFWDKWENEVYTNDDFYIDEYPMDWNIAIKPIIAKLYRAGMIAPAYLQPHPDVVPGFATANEEEHRPGKLDLFITYSNTGEFKRGMPPSFIDYKDWPEILPAARKFAAKHKTPRFALLRLWSAPHFYPLMMLLPMRQAVSFLDSLGRSWEWKFIPKDMPMSEWSVHNTALLRLGYLREQMMGLGGKDSKTRVDKTMDRKFQEPKYAAQAKFRQGHSLLEERTLNRGDLILVMGDGEEDLLKWVTAVTFAMQTKPWLREVDLWKSFVNVDLEFLEGLEKHWLD